MGKYLPLGLKIALHGCLGAVLAGGVAMFADTPSNSLYSGQCCRPNARNWGYYECQWRQWPCDQRPERRFPGAVGNEVIPAPTGQPQAPLPRASALPSRPETPGPTTETPGQPGQTTLPGEGTQLPGEGTRLPGEGTRLPGEGTPSAGCRETCGKTSQAGGEAARAVPAEGPDADAEAARPGRQFARVGAGITGSTCGEGRPGNSASFRGQETGPGSRAAGAGEGKQRCAGAAGNPGGAQGPASQRWRVAALPGALPAIPSRASRRRGAGRGEPAGPGNPCGLARVPIGPGRSAAEFARRRASGGRGHGNSGRVGGLLPRGIGRRGEVGPRRRPLVRRLRGANVSALRTRATAAIYGDCRTLPAGVCRRRRRHGGRQRRPRGGETRTFPLLRRQSVLVRQCRDLGATFSRIRAATWPAAASRRTKRGKMKGGDPPRST